MIRERFIFTPTDAAIRHTEIEATKARRQREKRLALFKSRYEQAKRKKEATA